MKPFQGIRTFCKTSTDEDLPYSVIGIPSDTAASFRSGSRFGPASIREASASLSNKMHYKFSTPIEKYTNDLGDIDLSIGNSKESLREVEESTNNIIAWGKHPVFLGGDHSNTLAILRALNKKYSRIALISFDAHLDNELEHEHGNWLFSALVENVIDATKTINIGARNPIGEIGNSSLNAFGGTIFTAKYAMKDMFAVVSNVKQIVGDTPVFISFDMDAIDPAYAPGVGNPEIAGLSTQFVMEFLEEVWDLNFVGMDVVETCPQYDYGNITSLAAATFVWEYLSMVICKNEVLAR